MSLMKRRAMTEKQKAASRANGGRSQGIASREGIEKVRASNLRHGLYSQAEDVVFDSLGEDREEFENLRQGLHESWPHADASQRIMVEELAAAIWRLERIDRRCDDLQIQQARELMEESEGMDSPEPVDIDSGLRLLSMQAVAFRQVLRISNRLLKAQAAQDKTPLLGLPQNVLKTKDEGTGDDENMADNPSTGLSADASQPAGSRACRLAPDPCAANALAGITPESIENKGH